MEISIKTLNTKRFGELNIKALIHICILLIVQIYLIREFSRIKHYKYFLFIKFFCRQRILA